MHPVHPRSETVRPLEHKVVPFLRLLIASLMKKRAKSSYGELVKWYVRSITKLENGQTVAE